MPCLERKNYFGPLRHRLERHFRIRAQVRPSSRGNNGRATTGRGEGVGCGQGSKYALIVATIVSQEEIL